MRRVFYKCLYTFDQQFASLPSNFIDLEKLVHVDLFTAPASSFRGSENAGAFPSSVLIFLVALPNTSVTLQSSEAHLH
jgi:hypothetical protein